MRGIIYKYTNKYNNKVYIGQTLNEEKRREKWKYLKEPYAGEYINRARAKYGIDAFHYQVLVEVFDDNRDILKQTLNELEIKYITLYKSKNPEFGYNLTDGGKSGNGQVCSEKTREKQRIAQTGKKKPMSNQGRLNISKAHKGPRPYSWKKVCQLDPNTLDVIKVWDSVTAAVKHFGDSYVGNLTSAIKGKHGRQLYRGYRWKYYGTTS